MTEKNKLTKKEVETFKETLEVEKKKILDRANQHVHEAIDDSNMMPDEVDQADQETQQAVLLRIADKEQKLLREIDRALKKIDSGEFGFCEGTGDFIGLDRLKARPWARYSIEYKEMLERHEHK